MSTPEVTAWDRLAGPDVVRHAVFPVEHSDGDALREYDLPGFARLWQS